jgi:hypothetical protein
VRRNEGLTVDTSRWERFPLRAGDVVVTTPSKCGTTWMQHIVGMMLLDRVDFGVWGPEALRRALTWAFTPRRAMS